MRPLPTRLFLRPISRPLPSHQTRPFLSAPNTPFQTRLPNRPLPPLPHPLRPYFITLPLFLLALTASSLAIFNYQKTSSPIVESILYALRTGETSRRELGEKIYFRDAVPWIWGTVNLVQGRVDVRFGVKGTRGRGVVRFRGTRGTRMGRFEVQEWSLKLEDGRVLQLLDEGAGDPFEKRG